MSDPNGRGGHRRARLVARSRSDDASSTVEFALALPFVVLAIVLLLHASVFGADVVAAQALALQAARLASTSDDAAVADGVARVAGRRRVELDVTPPGEQRSAGTLVTVTVRVHSAAFGPFGADVWIPARVTLRTERP